MQLTDDPVVAHSAKADFRLKRERRIANEHNVAVGCQQIADPLGEASLKTDVDRSAQMTRGEVGRLPTVEKDRPAVAVLAYVVDVEQGRCLFIKQRAQFPVAMR